MSTLFTTDQLAQLKRNYASGIFKIHDGDNWIEYQTSGAMLKVIRTIEAELEGQKKPVGSVAYGAINKGYK